MFCSISGTTPEEPVISSRTGHLFEKSLIVKAMQVRHHDPHSATGPQMPALANASTPNQEAPFPEFCFLPLSGFPPGRTATRDGDRGIAGL